MKIPQLDLQNLDTLDLDKQPFSFDAAPIAEDLQTLDAQPLDLRPTELDIHPLAVDVQPLELVQDDKTGARISARPAMAAGKLHKETTGTGTRKRPDRTR